eukprot:snap_masked-scaffold_52-processed-gene-1.30-mRNA-1 protein AED:1.00 eAED:1.00 QI:0/0/0/0/1/1/5/0/109
MLFLNSKVQRGSRLHLPVVFVVLGFLKSRLLSPVLPALYRKLDTSVHFPFSFVEEKYFELDLAVKNKLVLRTLLAGFVLQHIFLQSSGTSVFSSFLRLSNCTCGSNVIC